MKNDTYITYNTSFKIDLHEKYITKCLLHASVKQLSMLIIDLNLSNKKGKEKPAQMSLLFFLVVI